MKNIVIAILLVVSNAALAQITGTPGIRQGYQSTWTFDNGNTISGGVTWTVTNGTVHSTTNPVRFSGTTAYTAVISFSATGTQTITARRTSNNAFLDSHTVSVIDPVLVPGSISGSQTMCTGMTPSSFSSSAGASGGNGSYNYQWQYINNRTVHVWTDISGATGASYQSGTLGSTTDFRRRVQSGSQTYYSNTITVTVASVSPGSIGNAQTHCYGGDPSTITNTGSASGGTGTIGYQWQISTNGSSFTDIPGAAGPTYTTYNPGPLTQTTWYRRRVTGCAGGLPVSSNSIKITIYSNLSAGSIGGTQSICYNSNPGALSNSSPASGGNGSHSYQWQHRSPGGSFSNISGATGMTYDPSNLTSTTEYRRRVISCGQTKYSNTVTISVSSSLNPGSVGNGQTVCYGGDPASFSNTANPSGGSGSYGYQWQYYTGSTWTNISGATANTYNPPALTASRSYRRRAISCGETKYSNIVKVIVFPSQSAGSISGSQTVCYNGNPSSFSSAAPASGGTGSYTYQWQRRAVGGSWTNISGATSSTYDPGNLTSTTYFRRNAYSCTTVSSNVLTVTVRSALTAGTAGASSTVCYGSTPANMTNILSPSGGDGLYSYQWQQQTYNGSSWSSWSNISGATANSYQPPALTITTNYRRRVISCGETQYTSAHQVTVRSSLNPGSVGNGQTACYGGDPSAFSNTADASGGNSSYGYQWQYYDGSTWNNISGATAKTYDPPALTASRSYRRRAISCGEVKYSNIVKVIVYPSLSAGSISGSQTVCYNGNPSSFSSAAPASGGTGSYTYQWQQRAVGGSWTNISGATSSTYDPGNLTSTTYFRRNVSSCTTVSSNVLTVTVRSALTAGTAGASSTVCYGSTPANMTNTLSPSGGDGLYSYQWQHQTYNGSSWSSWSNISGATADSYQPSALTITTNYRRRVISCGETQYTSAHQITVRSSLNPGSVGNGQTVCYGGDPSAFSNTADASGGNSSYGYQWQYYDGSTWNNISGATAKTYDPPALTASRSYRRRAISCGEVKYSNIVKVIVYPSQSAGSISGAQTICYNGNPSSLTSTSEASGGTGSYAYQWQQRSIGGSWADISGATGSTYDPGNLTSSTYFRRNVSSCTTVSSDAVLVTVRSSLNAGAVGTAQTINSGQSPSQLYNTTLPTGGDGAYTYQWQQRTYNGSNWSGWTNISGATSQDYQPSTLTSTTAFRRGAISCGQTLYSPETIITVLPALTPGTVASNDACTGEDVGPLVQTAAPTGGDGNYSYRWIYYNTSTSSWEYVNGTGFSSTAQNYDPPASVQENRSYRRQVISNGQIVESSSIKIIFLDKPSAPSVTAPSSVSVGQQFTMTSQSNTDEWYSSSTGGTALHTGQNYVQTLNLNTSFYVESVATAQALSSVCRSERTRVDVDANLTAGDYTTVIAPLCFGCTAPTLTPQTPQGATGTYFYLWEVYNASLGQFESVSPVVTDASFSPGAITADMIYRRKVSSGSQVAYSNQIEINLTPLEPGTINRVNFCTGEDPGILTESSPAAGGDGNFVYRWQYYDGTQWVNADGIAYSSSAREFDPPATVVATTSFRRQVKSGTQSANSPPVRVWHITTADAPVVTAPSPVAPGTSVTFTSETVADQWFTSSSGGTAFHTGSTLTETLNVNTTYYVNTTSTGGTNSSCESDFTPVTVIVNLIPGNHSGTLNRICHGCEAPTLSPSAPRGGSGTYFYLWQQLNTNTNQYENVTAGSDNTAASYSPGILTSPTTFRRRVTSNGQEGFSDPIVVDVYPELIVGTITADQDVCEGTLPAAFTGTNATGGDESYSYQWKSSSSVNGPWAVISGATSTDYDYGQAISADTWFIREVTSVGQTKATAPVKLTYHFTNPGTIAGSTLVCGSGSLNLTYTPRMSNPIWEVKTLSGDWTPVMSGGSPLSGASPLTSPAVHGFRYRVTGHNICDLSTPEVVITVQQMEAGTISGPSQFYGVGTGVLSLAGHTGTVAAWEFSEDEGTNWTSINGSNSASLSFTGVTKSRQYRALVDFPGCSSAHTSPFTVKVENNGFAGYISGPTDTWGSTNTGNLTFTSAVGSHSAIRWYASDNAGAWNQVGTASGYTFNNLAATSYYKVEIDVNGRTYTSSIHTVEYLETPSTPIVSKNYAKQIVPLHSVTDLSQFQNLTPANAAISYSYADGLGRGVQSVSKGATPTGKDLVAFRTFDPHNTVQRSYLPYAASGSDYYSNVLFDQAAYYDTPRKDVSGKSYAPAETHAYAETKVEASPRRLLLEQGAPGEDWQLGSGHTNRYSYRYNTAADQIIKFNVDDITNTSHWPAGSLNLVETTDENGNKVKTFTDTRGLTILKQVEQSANVWGSTANVYDVVGRLRYTFPPEAMAHIANNASWTLAELRDDLQLIFENIYDEKGRVIISKVPGKGESHIVYDPFDRVALSQDAVLKSTNQWTFTKTDRQGRVVYSGLYTDASTRVQLQAIFDALDYEGSDPWYEVWDGSNWSNTVYPTANLEIKSENYYDDYSFNVGWPVTQTFSDPQSRTEAVLQDYVQGEATGGKVKEESGWRYTTLYYDEEYRLIQSQSTNHLGGSDVITNYYHDYNGTLQTQIQQHTNGTTPVEIRTRFVYDTRLRLKEAYHKLNDEPEVLLSANVYGELGELIEKNIGNNIQSIDYSYNIRGWLTSINDASLSDGEGDLFGQEILYNEVFTPLGNSAAYNGNISGIKWSAYDTEGTGIDQKAYRYLYDKADRMINASYEDNGNSWQANEAFKVRGIQYDLNGNLKKLIRKDKDQTNIDQLSYAYHGNQLLYVTDNATENGFKDGNTSGNDYAYDVNGSIVKDLNKGIQSIQYNYLDKPTRIDLTGPAAQTADRITYTYDGAGIKLKTEVWKNNAVISTTDYIGGLRYEDGTLKSIAHSEGRIAITDSGEPDYQYVLTDHLGNTRRVLSSLPLVYNTTEDFEDATSAAFTDLHLHTNQAANSTPGGDGVARLSSGTTGALVLLRVDKGDALNLQINANYEQAPTGNNFLGTAFSALSASFSSSFAEVAESNTGIDNSFNNALAGSGMAGKDGTNTAPRAYLNYILFDLSMNYVTAGYQQISTAAHGSAKHETISLQAGATQSGYILAYLSNENQEPVEVHFDDFLIQHTKTNVVQALDYYPFGMTASSFTRSSADPTNYLFNGGSELNDITGYYETYFRQYDATIGRFHAIDRAAEKYTSQTPYNFAFNDPISLNDPLGDDPFGDYGNESSWYSDNGDLYDIRNPPTNFMTGRADLWGRGASIVPGGAGDWANGMSIGRDYAAMGLTHFLNLWGERGEEYAKAINVLRFIRNGLSSQYAMVYRNWTTGERRNSNFDSSDANRILQDLINNGGIYSTDLYGKYLIKSGFAGDPTPNIKWWWKDWDNLGNLLRSIFGFKNDNLKVITLDVQGVQYVFIGDPGISDYFEDFGGEWDPKKRTITISIADYKDLVSAMGFGAGRKDVMDGLKSPGKLIDTFKWIHGKVGDADKFGDLIRKSFNPHVVHTNPGIEYEIRINADSALTYNRVGHRFKYKGESTNGIFKVMDYQEGLDLQKRLMKYVKQSKK